MYVEHDIDFGPYFTPGEVILFRFKLISRGTFPGWGWAIDQVSIQQYPTGTESPETLDWELFPNPTGGLLNVEVSLAAASQVSMEVFNVFGSRIKEIALGMKSPGVHRQLIDLSSCTPGTYIVSIRVSDKRYIRKVLKH
jgi:hypothetical protein